MYSIGGMQSTRSGRDRMDSTILSAFHFLLRLRIGRAHTATVQLFLGAENLTVTESVERSLRMVCVPLTYEEKPVPCRDRNIKSSSSFRPRHRSAPLSVSGPRGDADRASLPFPLPPPQSVPLPYTSNKARRTRRRSRPRYRYLLAMSTPSGSPPTATPAAQSTPSPANTSQPPPTPSSSSPPLPSGRAPPIPRPPLPPDPLSAPFSPSPSSTSSVSTSLVVGVTVGGLVILLLLSFICVCCWIKKRPPPPHYYGAPPPPPPPHYYGPLPPPPPARKDEWYGQHRQQYGPPRAYHFVKGPPGPPPPPPPPPPLALRPPRPPSHLPPPPMISSSGGLGSNNSGAEDPPTPSAGGALGFSKSTFTYEELAMATDDFSDANLLGQGGFGYVHRGALADGKDVAIKQLKPGSGQGEREFQAEVEIISRVHHKHLVSLVGYCISGGKRLLVYEFVPNNTLGFHLHGKGQPTMEWSIRLRIALGSAKGLAYLHEDCHPKIIHRDIKASNILLDYKYEAKVADFGLAKFASDTDTHISTRVMGTFGYLAPEYATSGKLTDKSDVFSFGVMLLELITGRRPIDSSQTFTDESLVDWARPLLARALDDGNYDALVDPRLGKKYNLSEMARMVSCAAACVRHSARRRPRMSQIARALEGDTCLEDLNEGIRPGHSMYHTSYGSSDYDSGQYGEDIREFRKMVMGTEEYATGESIMPTAEYAQNPSTSSSEGRHTQEIEMGKKKDVSEKGG